MYDDIIDRFELLILETIEEKRKRISKEKEEREKIQREYERKVEKTGVCEGCNEEGKLRWVRDREFYSCYDCFLYDLDCEASVMVPIHRASDLKDYVSEGEWEELWEEENNV